MPRQVGQVSATMEPYRGKCFIVFTVSESFSPSGLDSPVPFVRSLGTMTLGSLNLTLLKQSAVTVSHDKDPIKVPLWQSIVHSDDTFCRFSQNTSNKDILSTTKKKNAIELLLRLRGGWRQLVPNGRNYVIRFPNNDVTFQNTQHHYAISRSNLCDVYRY